MGLFADFSISGSSLYTHRKWMDAISDNIANINTIHAFNEPAFQEKFIMAQAANVNGSGGGVRVSGTALGDATGVLHFDPANPNANERGYVRAPNIDLSTQMTNLIMAQRGYQLNINAIQRAQQAYQAALSIGR